MIVDGVRRRRRSAVNTTISPHSALVGPPVLLQQPP